MAPRTQPATAPKQGRITYVDGKPARIVSVPVPGEPGEYWETVRYVALPGMTLAQAREKGLDFFHSRVGWIRGGYKIEKEFPLTPLEIGELSDQVAPDFDETDPEGDAAPQGLV